MTALSDELTSIGYVYLIGPLDGCYKVGVSKDPERRLGVLSLPEDTALSHVIPSVDAFAFEKFLHIALAHRFVEGVHPSSVREWFRLDDAELAAIRSIPRLDTEGDIPASLIALHLMNRKMATSKKIFLPISNGRNPGEVWPGRKPRPISEKYVSVNTTLPPETAAKLAAAYGGSASRGLRALAVAWSKLAPA